MVGDMVSAIMLSEAALQKDDFNLAQHLAQRILWAGEFANPNDGELRKAAAEPGSPQVDQISVQAVVCKQTRCATESCHYKHGMVKMTHEVLKMTHIVLK